MSALLGKISRAVGRPLREVGLASRALGFPRPLPDATERRARYERDGFVLGERLLSNESLRLLRREFDRLWALCAAPSSPVHGRSVTLGRSEYHCVYDLERHSEAFDRVIRDAELIDMLKAMTGVGRFRLLKSQVQVKPPRVGGFNGWHRDMPTFPLIRPYTGITAWIPLDDATEESGCMSLVPESHCWGEAWDIATDWGIPELPKSYRGHRVRVVPSPVAAGYVHFHHDMVWHSSGENRTARPRRALALHYINADALHSAHELSEYKGLPYGARMAEVLPVEVG